MTKQQQTELKSWKQNPDQELPKSLENAFIERCLEELKNNEKSRNRFNLKCVILFIQKAVSPLRASKKVWVFETNGDQEDSFHKLCNYEKIIVIQTLLSRTSDGQAVMPFLNVKIKNSNLTLDNLLYNSFVESLRVGKTFDEALKIINLIYCENV